MTAQGEPVAEQQICDVDVSVVIVNWNARDYLRGCIRSITEETRLRTQIIVVDNASGDGSADMVRSEFPTVQLIANSMNRGFAAANNQGLRVAEGCWLLLLNPDTVVLDGAIDKTIAFAQSRPKAGVIGCRVMESPVTVQRTCFAYPSPWNLFLTESGLSRLFPKSRIFGRPQIGWWDRDSEREVDVVSGMFMLVRREAMEQVGMMDEDYFVYAEEADWCFRFSRAGWRCLFAPVASILHLEGGGKSTAQIKARMYVQLHKSLLIFNRKNLGWRAGLMSRATFIGSVSARWVVWATLGRVVRRADAPKLRRLASAALRFHFLGIEPTS